MTMHRRKAPIASRFGQGFRTHPRPSHCLVRFLLFVRSGFAVSTRTPKLWTEHFVYTRHFIALSVTESRRISIARVRFELYRSVLKLSGDSMNNSANLAMQHVHSIAFLQNGFCELFERLNRGGLV